MEEFYELLTDHEGELWEAVTAVIQRAADAQEPGVPYDWSRARVLSRNILGQTRIILEVPYV